MRQGLNEFLAAYPTEIAENVHLVRELILGIFGNVSEQVDLKARLIGYSFGPGYQNTLFTIIPSQKAIKIGFSRGLFLSDPQRMLTGEGKVHRYLVVSDFYNQQHYIKYLLKESFRIWLQQG